MRDDRKDPPKKGTRLYAVDVVWEMTKNYEVWANSRQEAEDKIRKSVDLFDPIEDKAEISGPVSIEAVGEEDDNGKMVYGD